MVLDYSKWDKLELSDDSDIEGHPNVDKASLIRWKQRSIHEKRQQNKFRTDQLRVNIETNTDLLVRIDALIDAAKSGVDLKDHKKAIEISRAGQNKAKPSLATSPQQPLYDDLIESMLQQTTTQPDIVKALNDHRELIMGALKDEKKELDGLEEERARHITADDLKDGWNSTVFNKPQVPHGPEPKEKKQEIEVLNAGATAAKPAAAAEAAPAGTVAGSSKDQPKSKVSDDSISELLPATKQFGTFSNLELSGRFLMAHPEIINEGQKDALIMTAFDAELAGNSKDVLNIVRQSLLIQYSAMLGGVEGARKFISSISNPQHPARKGFEEEIVTTVKHIQNRCRILAEENQQEGEPVEQIQLHSVDPNTEIMVQVPEKGSEGYEIYEAFPANVKAAIQSKSLEKLNEVLGALSIPEAEELVSQLSNSGVLLVEEKIYDVNEWQEKKSQLTGEVADEVEAEQPPASPSAQPPVSTIDELD